ncbi:hypothetical protein VULLAG_LOCUS20322 [Vulpes lagopus]
MQPGEDEEEEGKGSNSSSLPPGSRFVVPLSEPGHVPPSPAGASPRPGERGFRKERPAPAREHSGRKGTAWTFLKPRASLTFDSMVPALGFRGPEGSCPRVGTGRGDVDCLEQAQCSAAGGGGGRALPRAPFLSRKRQCSKIR